MSGTELLARLANGGIIVAPGVYDHISLLIANEIGFDAIYASGYWGTASTLGEPDVGIAGYADFLRMFGGFSARSSAPVIADADTGFGSIINLAHAVRGYQKAGIAAMQIEDQPFPKICGHSGKTVAVPTDEMAMRVKVAIEARGEGDMLIIARTDARRSEGLAAAIDRLQSYAAAGADVLFLEAPESSEEIRQAAEQLDRPLMINAAHGGSTPILPPADYAALGVQIVIYPAGAPLAAAEAVQKFYTGLKSGDANTDGAANFSFAEMCRLLGIDDVIAFQERHKGS